MGHCFSSGNSNQIETLTKYYYVETTEYYYHKNIKVEQIDKYTNSVNSIYKHQTYYRTNESDSAPNTYELHKWAFNAISHSDYKCQLIIYSGVKLKKSIMAPNSKIMIPDTFTYGKLIVNPSFGDFIVMDDNQHNHKILFLMINNRKNKICSQLISNPSDEILDKHGFRDVIESLLVLDTSKTPLLSF